MKKKWLVYCAWLLALATGVVLGIALMSQPLAEQTFAWKPVPSEETIRPVGKTLSLVLTRTYLCGVRDEEHKTVSAEQLGDVMSAYKGWEIVSGDASKLILLKREQDISPACKENGYFGLSEDGVLTLFHGLPQEQNVIQTFYRINTAKMEASMSRQELENLKKGIRVRDLAEYHSVLSTYGEFQLGEDE
jgi:forespore regulator of the sigma-K checkpoint